MVTFFINIMLPQGTLFC